MTAQKGFTLIELLVSISIIGLVFSVIISAASNSKPTARDAERQADLKTIQGILQRYYSDQVYYPTTSEFSAVGVGGTLSKGSIIYTKSMPSDPSGVSYDYVAKPSGCNNLAGGIACSTYCLGAKLEVDSASGSCSGLPAGDTLQVGPPQ